MLLCYFLTLLFMIIVFKLNTYKTQKYCIIDKTNTIYGMKVTIVSPDMYYDVYDGKDNNSDEMVIIN